MMAKKWMPYHWQIPLAEEEIPMDKGGFRTVEIDAKKVINGLRSIKTYLASQAIESTDDFAREGFIESQKDIDDALALLKEQEEVTPMYGYWVQIDDDSNIWKCSVCDEPQIIIDGSPFENEWKFCPNCGSMMTKEEVKRE